MYLLTEKNLVFPQIISISIIYLYVALLATFIS